MARGEGLKAVELKIQLIGISERDFSALKEMALKADSRDLRVEGLRLLWNHGGSSMDTSGKYPEVYQEVFKESAINDTDIGVRQSALELVRDPKFLETRMLLDDSLLARAMAKSALEAVRRNPKGYVGPGWEY
ncbi:MAG: hypothetical protein KGH57_01505 [Candidatus Micrarchaeota archaeon]|nr:hypothetical protein [Candidatus Micrarchaeota archaeon]